MCARTRQIASRIWSFIPSNDAHPMVAHLGHGAAVTWALGPLPTWLNSKSMIMVRSLKKPGEMQWRYKPQEYVYIIYIYGHIWIYMFMYVHVNINKIHILGTGQKLPQHLPNRWSPSTPSEHWMVYFMEIPSKKKHKWMRTRKPPYILYIYYNWLVVWTYPLKNDGVRQFGWWHSQYIEK